tara:strand:- start:268 stop:732 length:465 start_codon:yes stop_codon:yes gene_type:complete
MSNKAMRVCDREVIERKVVDTWKQKALHDFEKEVKSSKVDKALDNLVKDFNSVVSKIDELETERNKLRDSIELMAKQFNNEHSTPVENCYRHDWTGAYIKTDISYGRGGAKYSLETNIPHEIRQNIQDELALQTMSGDFDANELIQSLVDIFVK